MSLTDVSWADSHGMHENKTVTQCSQKSAQKNAARKKNSHRRVIFSGFFFTLLLPKAPKKHAPVWRVANFLLVLVPVDFCSSSTLGQRYIYRALSPSIITRRSPAPCTFHVRKVQPPMVDFWRQGVQNPVSFKARARTISFGPCWGIRSTATRAPSFGCQEHPRQWYHWRLSVHPPPSGAELLEVSKKILVETNWRQRRQRKLLIGRRPGRKFGPIL